MTLPTRYVVDPTRGGAGKALLAAAAGVGNEAMRGWSEFRHVALSHQLPMNLWAAFSAIAFLVAGGTFVLAAIRRLDRRARIALDVSGLLVRDHSDEVVPWSAIARVWPKADREIWVRLHDPSRYPSTGWWPFPLRWTKGRADLIIALHNERERNALLAAFMAWRPALVSRP